MILQVKYSPFTERKANVFYYKHQRLQEFSSFEIEIKVMLIEMLHIKVVSILQPSH